MTTAILKAAGNWHSANDKLAMWAKVSRSVSADRCSRAVGSTSMGDSLRRDDFTVLSTSLGDVIGSCISFEPT